MLPGLFTHLLKMLGGPFRIRQCMAFLSAIPNGLSRLGLGSEEGADRLHALCRFLDILSLLLLPCRLRFGPAVRSPRLNLQQCPASKILWGYCPTSTSAYLMISAVALPAQHPPCELLGVNPGTFRCRLGAPWLHQRSGWEHYSFVALLHSVLRRRATPLVAFDSASASLSRVDGCHQPGTPGALVRY